VTAGWEFVARWPGGAVTALTTVGEPDAQTVLAGTAAGLHVSSDGGRTWRWTALGPAPILDALAASPTGSAILAGTSSGLYRSADGGQGWRQVVSGGHVTSVALAPAFDRHGLAFAGTAADGLLRSEDGGRDWTGANAGLLDLSVTSVAISPAFERDRTAFVGTVGGLYRSRNGGRAWRLVELGSRSALQAVAISPTYPVDGLVLAGTEADGLFRSTDGGQSWTRVRSLGAASITTIAFVATSHGLTVAVGTAEGLAIAPAGDLARELDVPECWQMIAPEIGPILSMVAVQDDEEPALLAGTIGAGIVRAWLPSASTPGKVPPPSHPAHPSAMERGSQPGDGDWRWQLSNDGLAGRAVVGLALALDFDRTPILAVASLDGGASVSSDSGITWVDSVDSLDDPTVTSIAVVRRARLSDPASSASPEVLAATPIGLHRSRDLGRSWERVDVDTSPDPSVSWLSTVGRQDNESSVVLAGGGRHLLLSLDGGESWRPIPLPDDRGEVVGGACSPDVARNQHVYAVARPGRHPGGDEAGDAGLDLWHTADFGERWSRVLGAPTATVLPIAVATTRAGEPVILAGRLSGVVRPLPGAQEVRSGQRRPIWLGPSISSPASTITALATSRTFAADQIVVASSGRSVYLSRDGGASFMAWDEGLDVPRIVALRIATAPGRPPMVYALGLGGTLWRREVLPDDAI